MQSFSTVQSQFFFWVLCNDVQEWELDLDQQSINPATSNYTQFLLDTASGKEDKTKGLGKLATPFEKTVIAAYTLGAMTPCMRLYAFLGKKFQELLDNRDPHPYKIWIDGYSSKDFEVCRIDSRTSYCFLYSILVVNLGRHFFDGLPQIEGSFILSLFLEIRPLLYKQKTCFRN